jgi:hypothetical protein
VEILSDVLAESRREVAAIKQARSAPVQEPVVFFDWYDNAHWGNEDFKEGCHRAWNAAIKYTTPPAAQPAPASWMETVTANLVREGVNKHKARELAEHFYGLAQRPFVGLTDEEMREFDVDPVEAKLMIAKLKEKNT